jgi:hypothetical protein
MASNSALGITSPSEYQGLVGMIESALCYAARNWRVFPVHTTISGVCSCGRNCGKQAGKHPRIKAWQKDATTDPTQVEAWWRKWPDANVGIACGGGLVVTDLDGPEELARFQALCAEHGGLPETLVAKTARGFHVFLSGDWNTTKKVPDNNGILVRGTGGYVIASPSYHASGVRYQWVRDVPVAPMPQWFRDWLQLAENNSVTGKSKTTLLRDVPAYLELSKQQSNQQPVVARAKAALGAVAQTPYEIGRLVSALRAIPANCPRDPWLHIGFALHSLHWDTPDGGDLGFELWHAWSKTGGDKYQGIEDLEIRWRSFGGRAGVTLGSLFHIAEQNGWQGYYPETKAPARNRGLGEGEFSFPADITSATAHDTPPGSREPLAQVNGHSVLPQELLSSANDNPLIDLNKKYAVIGDVGGKCLVLGWVPSKVDATIEIPSFQTFKSFSERYAHRYVTVRKENKDGTADEESKQLGAHWLKWPKRLSYEGIDMDPRAGHVLPNGALNLWRGFAVEAKQGDWSRMQAHIAEVLAEGDPAALDYIMRWSAWAVQNPGEQAEAALVFRGGKGSGKGTFAHALRRLFGVHGLHISNPKHLVGAFNAHLRNCLMLYADEAFWAGDKQGESTLKALITESTLTIEQKGVDAVQWHNRIHLIMTANAEWVVPASHDERRYAVFNVGERRMNDTAYFNELYREINHGGLSAMLYDLQRVDLKGWHPRLILRTKALMQQKQQSMGPLEEWWESILQDGIIPAASREAPDMSAAQYLINHAREFGPKLRDLTPTRLGKFLADRGAIKLHRNNGNTWRLPPLAECRERWERYYQGWKWEREAGAWQPRA